MPNRSSFSTLPGIETEIKQHGQKTFPHNVLQRYPVVSFFILAYAIAWSGDIAEAFLPLSWLPTFLLDFLINWAPGIAGLVVIAALQGKDGMRILLRPLFRWRVHPGWYFLVIGLAPLVVLTSIGLGVLFGGQIPVFGHALTPRLALLPVLLFFNAGEEVGWRGFALPRLQSRFTPLVASLILGSIWGFWHAPTYVLSGRSVLLLVFLPSVMAQTILLTWIYNRSGGNLLLVTLFHWSWDSMLEVIAPAWLPPAGVASMFVISTMIIILLAVVVATRINRRPFHEPLSQ